MEKLDEYWVCCLGIGQSIPWCPTLAKLVLLQFPTSNSVQHVIELPKSALGLVCFFTGSNCVYGGGGCTTKGV